MLFRGHHKAVCKFLLDLAFVKATDEHRQLFATKLVKKVKKFTCVCYFMRYM